MTVRDPSRLSSLTFQQARSVRLAGASIQVDTTSGPLIIEFDDAAAARQALDHWLSGDAMGTPPSKPK